MKDCWRPKRKKNLLKTLSEFRGARWMEALSIRSTPFALARARILQVRHFDGAILSQVVISNAFADLVDNLELRSDPVLSNMQSSIFVGETFQQNHDKKRKHTSIIPTEHANGFDSSNKICSKKSEAPLSVKIAALLPLIDHLPPKTLSADVGFNNGIKTNLKSDLELLDEEDELSSDWFDKNDEQILPGSRNLNDKSNETTQKLPNLIKMLRRRLRLQRLM